MAQLGEKYFEISRGYEQKSKHYKCPYITGVNIFEKEKPFIVAMGSFHADVAVLTISQEELISGKWDNHILKSNCIEFVKKLNLAIRAKEAFPQKFILDMIENERVK
jgi:hypothetical protein